MRAIRSVVLTIGIVLILLFSIQNLDTLNQMIELHLDLMVERFESGPFPIYFLILFAFFAGLLGAGCYGFFRRAQLHGQIRSLKKALRSKEEELSSLRNLPVLQSEDLLVPEAEKKSTP